MFANFGIVKKKKSIKCRKYDTKKINYNHIIDNEQQWFDILYRSKVAQNFSNLFEFYQSIFNVNILIAVFFFLSFEVSKFIEVFQIKLIGKNIGNLGF